MILILFISIALTFVVYDLINSWYIKPFEELTTKYFLESEKAESYKKQLEKKKSKKSSNIKGLCYMTNKDINEGMRLSKITRQSKPKKVAKKKILEKYETNK